MAATPNRFISPQSIKSNTAEVTTANVNYDTPANLGTLITAGANGARVLRITATPRETVADTQLQLYRDGDGTGTNKRLFESAKMSSYTMATGTEAPTTDFGFSDDNPLYLAAGEKVYCGIALSKKATFSAEWGDY